MKHKDPNYIAKLERAIAEKYGAETVENPKKHWDEDMEKEYGEQLKKFHQKYIVRDEAEEKMEVDGILITKKLLTKEAQNRTCPVCDIYSFTVKDDLYMNRYNCCFVCYVKNIEHRENKENK
jgi:hypothetical protein